MERLTLQPRPKTAEKETCLPAGDGLPFWSEVPLFAKLPVYPNPKGSYKLCTTGLCEPKHTTAQIDFDLTDPYGYVAFSQYEPLHDPHLRNHFNIPQTRRHLVRNGYIHDGKVVCDLKEFNKYRQYLRKICLLELEYEKQKKQCMADSRRSDSNDLQESYTKKRLEMVQKRMEELNKLRRQKYKRECQSKTARQRKRLDELDGEKSIRDARNKQRERKRKHTLQQHKEMIEKRNKLLMRRWKTQERERQQRLQNAKHKQLMEQRQKIQDSWESRKRSQEEKLSRDAEALVRIQEHKDKSIAERERRTTVQRQKLQDSLEKIRQKMKQEQEAIERKHARRLAERLALADIKNMARRNAKRRSRKPQFLSMWGIVSSLRRMELSNLKEKRSERFLLMLTDAYDEISIFIDETTSGDEFEDTSANEEELFQLKAREIVMDVYNTVKQEYYSEMLPLPDDEDYDGSEAIKV
ncbi:reticulocyte-binding protein homolog 2a-like [Mytilus californianus]|uniref:reticulocyte-binding protein homolog 2a-like n=1 Tax=Mytilus californianus TaxID=6549 RepID=UPI00224842C4|nr:reticulocyte-binding protein homolog 2a-like [Mytilus californianus]